MSTNRIMGLATAALGAGIAAMVLLGPLGFGVIRYHLSTNMEHQMVGGDVVSLTLVAPAALIAGVLWWRGSRLAPLLTLGPALYGAYLTVQSIVVPEYLQYPGNNEKFFPLLFAIVLLGLGIGLKAWSTLDPSRLPLPSRRVRRATGVIMIASASFLALAWSKWIFDTARGVTTAEYLEHPNGAWLIKTMDLAILVPAAVLTGIGLLRCRPLAVKAAYALSAALTLLAASVGAMATAMELRDDPSSQPAFIPVMLVAAIGMAALTAAMWRSAIADDAREADLPVREPERPANQPMHRGRGPAAI
jgi:hypothetical protein